MDDTGVTAAGSLLTGPYGSNLPKKDGTSAGLTKEQEEVVQAVFGDKAGYGYARASLDYVKGLGAEAEDAVNRMIEQLTEGRFKAEQWHGMSTVPMKACHVMSCCVTI